MNKLVFICLFSIIVSSCGKDESIFIPNEPQGSVDNVLETFGLTPVISKTIDPSIDQKLELQSGIVVWIPLGSIVDKNGQEITDNVSLQIYNYVHVSDFIRQDINTRVDGNLMTVISGIKLIPSLNGEKLEFNNLHKIEIGFPYAETDTSILNFGSAKSDDSNSYWTDFSTIGLEYTLWSDFWTVSGGSMLSGIKVSFDASPEVCIYKNIEDNGFQKVAPCVELPELFVGKNTELFLVQDRTNTVVRISDSKEDSYFCDEVEEFISSHQLDLISISSLGDDGFYYGTLSAYTIRDLQLQMVPKKKSKFEILDALAMF